MTGQRQEILIEHKGDDRSLGILLTVIKIPGIWVKLKSTKSLYYTLCRVLERYYTHSRGLNTKNRK